ncbi:hypothetical protein ACFE04_006207 [Oxalis oulophora]
MDDPDDDATPTDYKPLPPGCRFYPSDQQLLSFYLPRKIANPNRNDDVIRQIDVMSFAPYDLPDCACFSYGYKGRKRHWYSYVSDNDSDKVRVFMKGVSVSVSGGVGFWRKSGVVKEVRSDYDGGKVVLGKKTKFFFYLRGGGDCVDHGVKTDWVLYFYQLLHHDDDNRDKNVLVFICTRNSMPLQLSDIFVFFSGYCAHAGLRIKIFMNSLLHCCQPFFTDSFALCRIFAKSCGGKTASDNALSSCAEENVSTQRDVGVQYEETESSVRDIGIQCDIPGPLEDKADKNSVDMENDVSGFQLSCGVPLVGTHGLTKSNVFLEPIPEEQLRSILEEDFIELDDLLD